MLLTFVFHGAASFLRQQKTGQVQVHIFTHTSTHINVFHFHTHARPKKIKTWLATHNKFFFVCRLTNIFGPVVSIPE